MLASGLHLLIGLSVWSQCRQTKRTINESHHIIMFLCFMRSNTQPPGKKANEDELQKSVKVISTSSKDTTCGIELGCNLHSSISNDP